MLGGLILSASLVLQIVAAIVALRLIRLTGRRTGWFLIASAILLMSVRRGITLVDFLVDPVANPIAVPAEIVALTISVLMVGGLAWVGPVFRSIDETKESLRIRERQKATIAELGHQALAGEDIDDLAEESVRAVASLLRTELVKVLELRPDGKDFLLRAGLGWADGLVGSAVVPGGDRSQAGHTLLSGRPVIVDDLKSEDRFVAATLLTEHGVVSGASVRIGPRDRPYGVLGAHTREHRVFSDDDIHYLEAVANVLADAVRLSAETARLRRLVESAPYAMVIIDGGGEIVLVNAKAEEMFGYSRDEVVGRSMEELIKDWSFVREDGERVRSEDLAVNVTRQTGRPLAATAEITWPRGSRRWLEVRTAPLTEAGDADRHAAVVTFVDVTEERRLEDQMHRAQKMEAVGRLAGGVAHDFNNLMTVINGLSELALKRGVAEERLRSDLETILRAGTEAAGLTNSLLAVSRQQVLRPRVMDLNATVSEIEVLLRRTLEEHIEICTKLDSRLGRIRADPGQVHQVLLNLAVNARDAMPTGGRLTITTANRDLDGGETVPLQAGSYVELSVEDTGTGMSEEIGSQVFEPFFTTKSPGEGTGLGLSTVYGIVQQSGGHVAVESEVGRGSRFRVLFPCVGEEARAEQREGTPSEAQGGDETVLLLEDNDPVRDFSQAVLEGEGYHVLAASDLESALALARDEGPIDLLVTDLVMPGAGGVEARERIARDHPRMKTLFISGYAADRYSSGGELDLPGAFLAKPFRASDLARNVRELLDQEGE